MPPIQLHSNWNQRPSDFGMKTEPLKKYFFISEGAKTEYYYFFKLKNLKKELGIHPLIDIICIEKTGKDTNVSNPKRLIQLAKQERDKLIASDIFEKHRDRMIVVFDADIYSGKEQEFLELVKQQEENLRFGISYPDFELFLLLHIQNAIQDCILPNKEWIFNNKKKNGKRPCQILLSEQTGINSKKNAKIGDLAEHVDIAIIQEKFINQDIKKCLTDLTSNLGVIIENIKKEKLPYEEY